MILAAIDWLDISIKLLLIVFVLVALLMSLLIMMQRPKQEGLGAAFGSGMTDQMFGARTTNVLQKGTVWLGSMFFVLTLTLAILYARQNENRASMVKDEPAAEEAAVEEGAEESTSEETTTEETSISLEDQLEGKIDPADEAPAGETPAEDEAPAMEDAPAEEEAPVEGAAGEVSEEPADDAAEAPEADAADEPAEAPAEEEVPAGGN